MKTDTVNYVEIAGGGRYDKLVEHFTITEQKSIPATGFAFGLERVVNCLYDLGFEPGKKNVTTVHSLDGSTADLLGILQDSSPKAYLSSCDYYNKSRRRGKRVDVYTGDDVSDQNITDYLVKSGAKETETIVPNKK